MQSGFRVKPGVCLFVVVHCAVHGFQPHMLSPRIHPESTLHKPCSDITTHMNACMPAYLDRQINIHMHIVYNIDGTWYIDGMDGCR